MPGFARCGTRRPGWIAIALAIALTGCAGQGTSPGTAASSTDAPQLELIGVQGFSFEDFALDLQDLGYEVSSDGAVSPQTDLLLVVVNAQDGPMPQTRDAVAALAGSVIPRAAIALIDVDKQPDPEIEDLVVLETVELLTRFGIAPIDASNIVRAPGPDIATTIDLHLRRAPRDYRPAAPSEPPAPTGPVRVDNFAGVPMGDALELLDAAGLVGEVLADPDFGVVSECDPLVQDQEPAPGVMLAPGGVVGLLVPAPDKVDPTMAGCLLPELTRAEVDARRAEIAAQPSP